MQIQLNNFRTENFFSIGSEKELVDSFRLRDQKKLILPDGLKFPLNVRSYLTWREPSGVYTYLVFKRPGWDLPRGVAFKRASAGAECAGGLCSWCHAYCSSDEISLLSVKMSSTVSCSYLLCHDLRCIEKIEEASALSGRNPEKYIDDLYRRIEKMFENIANYELD